MSVLDLAAAHTDKCIAAARARKSVVGTGNWSKKVRSVSAAVLPNQIKEAAALDRKLGVPVEYNSDGTVNFDNSSQMRKWAKAHGKRHFGYT